MKNNRLIRTVIACLLIISTCAFIIACGQKEEVTVQNSQETPSTTDDYNETAEEETAPDISSGRFEDDESQLLPGYYYTLEEFHEVDARQGVAWDNGKYYCSSTKALYVYDSEWNCIQSKTDPFDDTEEDNGHLGDIDVYDGKIYAAMEKKVEEEYSSFRIAVYDKNTLELIQTYPISEESHLMELSGLTVDPDHEIIWLCSWKSDLGGRYLYAYDLNNGEYLGEYRLYAAPLWIQGIVYYDGYLYLTADDGDENLEEPDHIYRCSAETEGNAKYITLERTLDDVSHQGVVQGLSVDRDNKKLLVNYMRYNNLITLAKKNQDKNEDYNGEISEIFIYDMTERR